ncbi:MAG: mannose-1-phosphate guanylyltransferase [Gemmatimonadetes bacterium]|nr:NTP transferase domain-containing protein [Gemmatimonadota bacterium]NNM06442.1 mannose-1-phosphate guanylyltransferase [Gemmatimonadota bacterium]
MPESTASSETPDPTLWVTILAGGSGTRFWPASTPSRPKQLLPLVGDRPLIRDTLDRALALARKDRVRILTGAHLLDPFRDALGEMDPATFLIEPQARGTGPVLVWAAWEILKTHSDATLVSLHADHAIEPLDAFLEVIRSGARGAREHEALFTVAIPPTRPETGYGYIQQGDALDLPGEIEGFWVRSFVEKPDAETAHEYLNKGYAWNSGIFIWQASVFLEEVRAVAPELGGLLHLLEAGDVEGFFRQAPAISVDEAVLERSSRVASVRATFKWDDVGSWEALSRTQVADEGGNILMGSVYAVASRENVVMAEEGSVVLFGVDGLAVVRSGDIVLVADRSRTPDLKSLLEALPPHLRDPDRS